MKEDFCNEKKMVSVLLAAAMGTTALVGFGTTAYADDDVLEFYHGYYQDESEWAAAQVMRDIYDEFAKEHADGPVTFKPIAVENRDDIVSAQVAGGSFPDLVDVGGGGVPQAALSQELVYDLKPYIDENGLQDAVGLNYTQHDMDGHIYAVHDQIESRGYGIIPIFLKKPELQRRRLQTGILLEKQWKKSVLWTRMCTDTLQDRAPAIL